MSSKPRILNPSPPQQQPPPPPYSPGPPPYKPPPSNQGINRTLLIVVIVAVVLVIVIPIIISAALYFMISDMINQPPPTSAPNVSIRDGEPTGTVGEWRLRVYSVSIGEQLSYFQVAVKKEASIAISATSLDTIKSSGATGGGLYLSFSDATDDDKLSGGDWFTLGGTDNTSDYQIIVYWKSSGNSVSGDTGKIEQ